MTIWKGRREKIGKALTEAVELTGVIFGIILAASVFSLVLRGFEGDLLVESIFLQLPEGGYWALLCVMLIVFMLGFLIEFVEITYVVVPITAPVLFALGIDPIWFAVLMAVNLQISFLTPPMGISLFYYKSVSGIDTLELYRSVIPLYLHAGVADHVPDRISAACNMASVSSDLTPVLAGLRIIESLSVKQEP